MTNETTNIARLTPIHTDFGSNANDLLVVEYDVPQKNVKKTLFYKYGQLSIPKWALIPAAILTFGLLSALLAIILNAILNQSTSSVTYSQKCSKTLKCKSDLGLTCGSQSKCTCETGNYWYETKCVSQPTYGQKCNQTTECRSDLGLICAQYDGQCNCPSQTKIRTCDCSSTSYWTGSKCSDRGNYLSSCDTADVDYQCISDLYCNGARCVCSPNTQYWNYTAQQCFIVDKYQSICNISTSYSCDTSIGLVCQAAGHGSQCPLNATVGAQTCDCLNGTYWNGGSCVQEKTINDACFWDCECHRTVGLRCFNMSCVCPAKYYWSSMTSKCLPQLNYTQTGCTNTTECDLTQGLTCFLSGTPCNCPNNSTVGMCDCLTTQYYDGNSSSCQTLHLYNDTCYGDYMCDRTLGLFCQVNVTSALNCSCPEPVRQYMCDCNMSSYWDGTACVSRLAPNVSCSLEYQCQQGLTCIYNLTDIGIFSDVCRCPLGSYFVNGTNCTTSRNYTESCIGSYQCYESAPLYCRYNYTGLTCLDDGVTPLPACDCADNYFFNTINNTCLARLPRLSTCTENCQCQPPLECVAGICDCPLFYSSTRSSCVAELTFGDQCTSISMGCESTTDAYLICGSNGTCACNATGAWNGTSCFFTVNFRAVCTSDANCLGGLTCRDIKCASGNQKRCSCPAASAFSPTSQSCQSCTGSLSNSFDRYVINYPTSDLCVAVRDKGSSGSNGISFTNATAICSGFPNMTNSLGPQLLSVHSDSELTCIARVLRDQLRQKKCSDGNSYYLGFNSVNKTFFDGTPLSPSFNTSISASQCLTYCSKDDDTGQLEQRTCTPGTNSNPYGAICDFRIV